jgi:hypothetical protein
MKDGKKEAKKKMIQFTLSCVRAATEQDAESRDL